MSQINLDDITLTSLVASLAAAVADELESRGIVGAGGPPETTLTPAVVDSPADDAEGTKSSRKRKSAPPKAEEAEEEEAEEEAEEVEEEDEEEDVDLVPDALLAEAADAEEPTKTVMKRELIDFHVSQGATKKDITSALSDLDPEELVAEYQDYLARLLALQDDGKTYEFIESFEEPYKAARINEGTESLFWIVGGVTLTDEEVEDQGLGDPNAAPKKATKRTRKAPAKRK